jgi:rhodanese-related sulfurtransferase
MRRLTLPLAFLVAALALTALARAADHTTDSLETVQKNLNDKKAILLDVREENEWKAGHLLQALLVPLSKLRAGSDPKELAPSLDKEKIIYCHCAGGRRVLPAADILKELGYEIRPLKSGYKDLLEAGFPKAEE